MRVQDDFWSTSTYDLDNSALQSQRSFSSISVPNMSQNQSSEIGGNNHPEFVNHGLLLWNQTRAHWRGGEKSRSHGKIKKPVLSWNASYDNLLLSTSKRFPQPVPLSEMVDFLVDIWDQEGMYD
ncbi:uncharacterized protein LOC127239983 isoform X2 [Andrographis paniculata]|nr:uncharacterized protein LOC127239983 isoform X2 [Andrographis paniculata]